MCMVYCFALAFVSKYNASAESLVVSEAVASPQQRGRKERDRKGRG